MSDHLEPFETELRAGEELRDGRLVPDESAMRIHGLTTSCLQRVAVTDEGWSVLYRDPEDGRLWEHTYPESSLHGGGPALLHVISDQQAHERYVFSME